MSYVVDLIKQIITAFSLLLGTQMMECDGNLKKTANVKGFKKSFAVPLSRNPGSCTYIGGNRSKKDSLKKVKASRVADSE